MLNCVIRSESVRAAVGSRRLAGSVSTWEVPSVGGHSAVPAPVAQGIERRFPKPCVAGSNPAGGAFKSPVQAVAVWESLSKSECQRPSGHPPCPSSGYAGNPWRTRRSSCGGTMGTEVEFDIWVDLHVDNERRPAVDEDEGRPGRLCAGCRPERNRRLRGRGSSCRADHHGRCRAWNPAGGARRRRRGAPASVDHRMSASHTLTGGSR
jgi:hypothetical protein